MLKVIHVNSMAFHLVLMYNCKNTFSILTYTKFIFCFLYNIINFLYNSLHGHFHDCRIYYNIDLFNDFSIF